MNDDGLEQILERFPGRRVLVVGDLVLDEYLFGDVRRISPEAPVPVVELRGRRFVPGGAANAAANAAALGARVELAGVVGDDADAWKLLDALSEMGVRTQGVLVDHSRPTTTKTRVIAHSQQVVRIDREDRSPLPPRLEAGLLRFADGALAGTDACVLSDYAKGVVSPSLARRLIRAADERDVPVVVDPKGADGAKYRGAALVKPNLQEAALLLGRDVSSPEGVAWAGPRLLDLLGADAVLLTRGSGGMTLFPRGREPAHVPARAREVFDVTGAGDTVAAVLAVALGAGATPEQAARLAALAAAVAVGRVGTAAVRLDELASSLAGVPR